MRIVPIKNGINFRQLGGIASTAGGKIKQDLLFRSGALSDLNAHDCQFLVEHVPHVSILDYRDKSEIEQHPDVLWQGAHYIPFPANPMNADVSASILQQIKQANGGQRSGHAFMVKLYELLPFANPAYHQLVNLLLDAEVRPLLQHCAVGKDRTGVGCALTLFALGANEDTVMEDYLLTQETLAPFREKIMATLMAQLPSSEIAFQNDIFAAKADYLHAALAAIKAKYGAIDIWLEQDYGLTAEKRAQLQEKYLA